MNCFFVSDLHGFGDRYHKLFRAIRAKRPQAVFLGGDLLPLTSLQVESVHPCSEFIADFLAPVCEELRRELAHEYPRVFVIPGNDDPRSEVDAFLDDAYRNLWEYLPSKRVPLGPHEVIGYSYVPPSPFLLKDWERYDVSRFVEAGCVSPEEGIYSVPVPDHEKKYRTIQADLEDLTRDLACERTICLFHAPPHATNLDRAALDGKQIDLVPLDVHVGSIAVRRFIERKQPLLSLHGHIHESARITGAWKDQIGRTMLLSAAHDGPELALVEFDPADAAAATRSIL